MKTPQQWGVFFVTLQMKTFTQEHHMKETKHISQGILLYLILITIGNFAAQATNFVINNLDIYPAFRILTDLLVYVLLIGIICFRKEILRPIESKYITLTFVLIICNFILFSYITKPLYFSQDYAVIGIIYSIKHSLYILFTISLSIIAYIKADTNKTNETHYIWYGVLLMQLTYFAVGILKSVVEIITKMTELGSPISLGLTIIATIFLLYLFVKILNEKPVISIWVILVAIIVFALTKALKNTIWGYSMNYFSQHIDATDYGIYAIALLYYFVRKNSSFKPEQKGLVAAIAVAGIAFYISLNLLNGVARSAGEYARSKDNFPTAALIHFPSYSILGGHSTASYNEKTMQTLSINKSGANATNAANRLLKKHKPIATYEVDIEKQHEEGFNLIEHSNSTPEETWFDEENYPITYKRIVSSSIWGKTNETEDEGKRITVYVLEVKSTAKDDERFWVHGFSRGLNISANNEVSYWAITW